MTDLSPDHKLNSEEDSTLDRLLMLHGEVIEIGHGYWVKFEATRIEPSTARPHGVSYALCLLTPDDERIVCFDNAHPIEVGSGPAARHTATNDHQHKGTRVKPYDYRNAEALLVDFWNAVDAALKERGIE